MKTALFPVLLACLLANTLQPAKDAKPAAAPPAKALPAGHPGLIDNDPALQWPKAKAEDVNSIDAIMAAFYAVPAGNAGQARDWDRYRSLFAPDARMIPARSKPDGGAMAMYVSITDYISLNKTYFEKGGFMDKEVARRTETFGHMAQVWSTFESRHKESDAEPYVRGINSVQLLKDGDRWRIVNVFWDFEDATTPIPADYLKSINK